MSVHGLLNGIDPRLTWPGFLVLLVMAGAAIVLRLMPSASRQGWVLPALRGAVILLVAGGLLQFALAVSYFSYPRYLDWAEPMIAAASWIGWRGSQFYPALDGGDVIGNWYGPLLFHITGFGLWLFGPSIETSKILGVVAFLTIPFLAFHTLRRAGANRGEALGLALAQTLLQSAFANQSVAFGVRSDPFLLLGAQLGICVGMGRPNLGRAALLGFLMGLAVNLKIFGAFFYLPVFAYFIQRAGDWPVRIKLFLTAGLCGVIALVAPFLPHSASLPRYIALFGLSGEHGLSRWIFQMNMAFLAMLLCPLAWLYLVFRPRLPEALLWFGAAAIPSLAVVTILGAVNGGGPYNLLSFAPTIAWALVQLLVIIRGESRDERRIRLSLFALTAAFLIGYSPVVASSWDKILLQASDRAEVRQARAQIAAYMAAHPDRTLEVGPGALHDLRVMPVFRGDPLPIDGQTWADLKSGGVSEALPRATIESCRVDDWLMPAKEPIFRAEYGPLPFSPGFYEEFRRHYRKEDAGEIFDRWSCVTKS